MLDMLMPVLAVGGLVAFFGGLIVLLRWMRRVVHRSIEGFAKAHGLRYVDDALEPRCEGSFEGRELRVANEQYLVPWGLKTRPVPMFVVRLRVSGAPQKLWLGKAPLQLQPQPPRQVLQLDPRIYGVVDGDADDAVAWLSPARQARLAAAFDAQSHSGLIEVQNLFLEEGWLILRMTHMQKADAAWIEQCVRALLPHATSIEAG